MSDHVYFYPTPQQLLDLVHVSTERIAINIVVDNWLEISHIKGLKRFRGGYLTTDLNRNKEYILKYYPNARLWNLHVEFDRHYVQGYGCYKGIEPVLVANVHFSEILESYLKAKKDGNLK